MSAAAPAPTARHADVPGPRRRGARTRPDPQPGVDELQPERSRRHADRAVRVPHREPALPHEPDPGAEPARVPLAARRPAPARIVRPAGSSRSRTTAGRSRRSRCTATSRCARDRCRSAARSGSTSFRSRRASYCKVPIDSVAAAEGLLRGAVRVVHRRLEAGRDGAAALPDDAAAAGRDRPGDDVRPLAVDRAAAAQGRRHRRRGAAAARAALAGKTVNLGIAPVLDDPDAQLSPLGRSRVGRPDPAHYQLPTVPSSGSLGADPNRAVPRTARSTRGRPSTSSTRPGSSS